MKSKKKVIKNIILCVCCGLVMLFSFERSHIRRIESWILLSDYFKYFSRRNLEIDAAQDFFRKQQEREVALSHYYLMEFFKGHDLQRAIDIGEEFFLENAKNRGSYPYNLENLLVHELLGEMYFYSKKYEKAKEHFFEVLLMSPAEENIRYNYELANYFFEKEGRVPSLAQIDSSFENKIESDAMPENATENKENAVQLENSQILDASEVFNFYINTDSISSDLPQW